VPTLEKYWRLPLSTLYSVSGVGGSGVLEEDAGSPSPPVKGSGGALWAPPAGSGAEPQHYRNWIWCILAQKKIWQLVTIQMTDIFTAQICIYSYNLCVCVCARVSSEINTVLYHMLLTSYCLTSLVGYFSFLALWSIFFTLSPQLCPTLPLRQKSDTKIMQRITTK